MLRIHNLLNPEQSSVDSTLSSPTTTPTAERSFLASDLPKMSKHTTVGQAIAPVNFPPYLIHSSINGKITPINSELVRQHDRFMVALPGQKAGQVDSTATYVPYQAEKRKFTKATVGREGVAIFQYEFRVPGNSTTWTMNWDYQIGLTRVSSCFKASGLTKTDPNKALSTSDKRLHDVSYNFTGGRTECQGFWIPYHCARAICATFCYNFRWALTPIFGPEFIHECLPPSHPDFGKYKIDTQLVRDAELAARDWINNPARYNALYNTGIAASIRSQKGSTRVPRPARARQAQNTVLSDRETDQEMITYGRDSPPVSPKTIPCRKGAKQAGFTSINRHRDSVVSSSAGTSVPTTPLVLPEPVMPFSVKSTVQRSSAKSKKGKRKASHSPGPQTPATTLSELDRQEAANMLHYNKVNNYVITSAPVTPLLSKPPPKKQKRATPGASKGASGQRSYAYSGREWTAASALMSLFARDQTDRNDDMDERR